MRKTIRYKYIERKLLITLNGESFIDSRQHINPHDLVYCPQYYLLIHKAQFRDDKTTARIKINTTNGIDGAVDIPIAAFEKLPILEIIIEYDEQSTSKSNS